jgi:hypothetical protein
VRFVFGPLSRISQAVRAGRQGVRCDKIQLWLGHKNAIKESFSLLALCE